MFSKIKTYIYIIAAIIIIALITALSITHSKLNNVKHDYDIAVLNNKAYDAQLTQTKLMFQFSIDQLQYINDSVIRELDSTRKVIGIKDKQLKAMSKVKEYVYIIDTIINTDTIFAENFVFDTCISNQWYETCLNLSYPNNILTEFKVNLDTDCFIYTTKEPVKPPKKTCIGRFFQKKHWVCRVVVKENNPYANVKEYKYIKIVE